jgi:hypothetical protein
LAFVVAPPALAVTFCVVDDVHVVAEEVLNGDVRRFAFGEFEPGACRALAADIVDDLAAVLVARCRAEQDWDQDVVLCILRGGWWQAMSSGGVRCGELPTSARPQLRARIVAVVSASCDVDERRCWGVGGFVEGEVVAVEMILPAGRRRVAVARQSPAFVVVGTEEVATADNRFNPTVHAIDTTGTRVD